MTRLLFALAALASTVALAACGSDDKPGPQLVFADEFNGPAGTPPDPAKWRVYDGPGHAGNGLRRPSAFAKDGRGNMVVTAQMVAGQVVSGGMASRLNMPYGRYVARVRTERDPTAATSGVILTWPQSNASPPDGENDFYETGHFRSRKPLKSFIHYGGTRGVEDSDSQLRYVHSADGAQWHTITMDWTPDAIVIHHDGTEVWRTTNKAAIPDVPHHLCVQLDAFKRTMGRPVRMYVDYVRIYRLP